MKYRNKNDLHANKETQILKSNEMNLEKVFE